MDQAFIITAFATLFVVMDPIALAPLFIALTQGATQSHRLAVGLRACLVATALLTMFGLFGEQLLRFIGISLPAFRIAGGILLFLTALDMLFERRTQRRERQSADHADPSVFPLATPLIAGPGALATMVLLVGEANGEWQGILAVHLVMVVVMISCFLAFAAAGLLERLLGHTGNLVITRLLGMLLAALSVQFVVDGVIGTGLIGP